MHSAVLSCELQTLRDTAKVLHEVAYMLQSSMNICQ